MSGVPPREPGFWASRAPMTIALTMVAAVWLLGAVWSFTEQTAFADTKGFADPALLPLVLDGLAAAMAGVAFAASLDGRPAVPARVGTALAVLASAGSNGVWAAERSAGPVGPDLATVAIGAGMPIVANIAFEVLLAEFRRQVQRARGVPAPTPLPTLRLTRLMLAPRSTFAAWRREVLARTEIAPLASPAAENSTGTYRSLTGTCPCLGEGPPRERIEDEPPTVESARAGAGPAARRASDAHSASGSTGDVAGLVDVLTGPPASRLAATERPAAGPSAAADDAGVAGSPAAAAASTEPDDDDGAAPGESAAEPAAAAAVPVAEASTADGGERNERVWRLARAMLDDAHARGVAGRDGDGGIAEDDWSGSRAATVLGGSRRNGQRLVGRAAALARALQHDNPPTPPAGISLETGPARSLPDGGAPELTGDSGSPPVAVETRQEPTKDRTPSTPRLHAGGAELHVVGRTR